MFWSSTRRRFLWTNTAALGLGSLLPKTRAAQSQTNNDKKPKKKPAIDSKRVQQFVLAGHRDLDEVKALLLEEPGLINACWDWGGGDFETALGGAAHVGLPEIATYLLEQGARLDLFAAAMLGKLDVVKASVASFPGIIQVPGPHGIPLIAHAKAGGEAAADVLAFLESSDESTHSSF